MIIVNIVTTARHAAKVELMYWLQQNLKKEMVVLSARRNRPVDVNHVHVGVVVAPDNSLDHDIVIEVTYSNTLQYRSQTSRDTGPLWLAVCRTLHQYDSGQKANDFQVKTHGVIPDLRVTTDQGQRVQSAKTMVLGSGTGSIDSTSYITDLIG